MFTSLPTHKNMNPKLLIVDDDEGICSQIKWALSSVYNIIIAQDRTSAVEAFRNHRPKVVLLDLGLPPFAAETKEGFEALSELLLLDRGAKVIVVTGQSNRENALTAIKMGAYDFLCKPVHPDELKIILGRAFHIAQLESENQQLLEQQNMSQETFEGMFGTSLKMLEIYASIRKVATTKAPVLVVGESGTGKEMAARAIHRRSAQKDGPFIPINCAAIPEALLESELFGHEKGSFTGAHTQRTGRIEMADHGTLFLDEIGDLPLPLQVKLLRFLQEQTIERVGGRKTIQIDTRIIAATNADLKQKITDQTFREDLFYRLAVVVITMPPLRDKANDILLLAKAFLKRFSLQNNITPAEFSRGAVQAMLQYSWPGNVRELENRVKRAMIMCEGNIITPSDLELSVGNESTTPVTLKEARDNLERQMISQALARHGGKIAPAAIELCISRPTFYELMDKLGIKRPDNTKMQDSV